MGYKIKHKIFRFPTYIFVLCSLLAAQLFIAEYRNLTYLHDRRIESCMLHTLCPGLALKGFGFPRSRGPSAVTWQVVCRRHTLTTAKRRHLPLSSSFQDNPTLRFQHYCDRNQLSLYQLLLSIVLTFLLQWKSSAHTHVHLGIGLALALSLAKKRPNAFSIGLPVA
jgi:hypothetical protein